MSVNCEWLHETLKDLPLKKGEFKPEEIPEDGVYFFYENDEKCGYGDSEPRIVRIGTHRKDGNLKSRISNHYLFDESKMKFDSTKPAPHEFSIFRKNIGRALLSERKKDEYLKVWDMKFKDSHNRENCGCLRNIDFEKEIEQEITDLIRNNFSFRYLRVGDEKSRLGIEKKLISTIANCTECKPTKNWLGFHSTKCEIISSGMWQTQHTKRLVEKKDEKDLKLNDDDKKQILQYKKDTLQWISEHKQLRK